MRTQYEVAEGGTTRWRRAHARRGKFHVGAASTENASRGYNDAATAANADCTRNPLRVLCDKVGTVYQIHPNHEQSPPCSGLLSPARVRRSSELEHSPDGCMLLIRRLLAR